MKKPTILIFILAIAVLLYGSCKKKEMPKAEDPDPPTEQEPEPDDPVIDFHSVVGKVICGYQGWFNCYGDGSPVARWVHWSSGVYNSNAGIPSPDAVNFEIYPDMSEYPSDKLYQTALGNLNNGEPARLFSSYDIQTVNKHFEWMKDNEIDGVALQRFLSVTRDGVFRRNIDTVAAHVRRSAEKHGRIFYMMYDLHANDTTYFKDDWLHMENDLKITNSPNYARQGGKPVICLWGFGLSDRTYAPAESLAIINWLKGKGYYVIGGVPTNWRSGTGDSYSGYRDVYRAFDMISPWAVGRFRDLAGADNFKANYLAADLSYCRANRIDYQPVMFPGFAWSNMKKGEPQNQISRNAGEFFWRQVVNIKSLDLNTAYVAMFDEYDEATVIAKMADSFFAVPNDQYFLTSSADGVYVSGDFYLRLVGQATNVIKGTASLTFDIPVAYSVGPIWFRTSVQQGYDAMPFRENTADDPSLSKNVGGYNGTENPQCKVMVNETSHLGDASILVAGQDKAASGGSFHYFKVFDVNIPVNPATHLSFWTYPTNSLSRYVSIDLVMTDGTMLRSTAAADKNGMSMKPSAGRGTINSWTQTVCNIGSWLNGKTIDKLLIGYDHEEDTGDFRTYIDDIVLEDK